MTVHMQCIIPWPVLAVSSGAELPSVLPVPNSHVLPFPLPDLLVEAGCTKCCWNVDFCFIFLFEFVTLFVPSLLTPVWDWPAYHLYLEIWYLSELGECELCCALTASIGEILLLPLVVVTGIFLKNKSCLHFSYQECLWGESMQWRSFTEPCPCCLWCFLPLCWVSTVLDVESEDCSNRLHFRLIKVLLPEAFIALNQICKSIHKLEPPFL